MSIKDLLRDYLNSAEVVHEFSRSPGAMLDRYGVDAELRRALAERNMVALERLLDGEAIALLRRVGAVRPALHFFYPSPILTISEVSSVPDPIRAGQSLRLRAVLGWTHSIVPDDGIPPFLTLRFVALTEGGVGFDVRTVPVYLDLEECKLIVREDYVRFDTAGDYLMSVEVKSNDGTWSTVSTAAQVHVEP